MKKNSIVFFYMLIFLITASCKDSGVPNVTPLKTTPVFTNSSFTNISALQGQLHSIAESGSSSIVFIGTEKTVKQNMYNPFEFFFNDPGNQKPQQREFKQEGLGSGVIYHRVNNKYYIITNNHVVENADKITVTVDQSKIYEAKLLGGDPEVDIAVLEITTNDDLVIAALGNSDNLKVGDFVVAIGNPFGLSGTMTFGIISALGRSDIMSDRLSLTNFIQTDASINPGNSGGGLIDMNGTVIGINTLIYSRSGGNIGIGFAIPINVAKRIADQLVKTGKIEHGYLGVQFEELNQSSIETLGLKNVQFGMMVKKLLENGPAEKGGIKVGDILIELDGKELKKSNDLVLTVANYTPGTIVSIKLLRAGKIETVKIKLGNRIEMTGTGSTPDKGDFFENYGFELADLNDSFKNEKKIPANISGVVVTKVVKGSLSDSAGIRQNDIIIKINNQNIKDIVSLKKILDQRKGARNYFFIYRENTEMIVMM